METKISVKDLNLYYGELQALKNIGIDIAEKQVTALIGPSGCGKSTFLKTLNRMNDLIPGVRIDGQVLLDGEDLYARGVDVTLLRKRVGMVFQKPNPLLTAPVSTASRGAASSMKLWSEVCAVRLCGTKSGTG